jgi:hypothetical protein
MTFCSFNGNDELKKVVTVCIGGGRFLVSFVFKLQKT